MTDIRTLPPELVVDDRTYRLERILKDDFFAVNALYRGEDGTRQVLKITDFRFFLGPLCRPLARWMSLRESNIYQALQGIPGIPRIGPRHGGHGFIHEYVEGRTFFELNRFDPPVDFFANLLTIFEAMHARRIVHVDSHKKGNLILGNDGKPYLIDFQIAGNFGTATGGSFAWLRDWLFRQMVAVDLYHLYKIKHDFRPDQLEAREIPLARRPGITRIYEFGGGRYLRWLKRRIYPSGSNETIWYKWRKVEDKSRRMP